MATKRWHTHTSAENALIGDRSIIPGENKKALLEYAPENPASLDAIEAHDAPHFSGVVDWTAVMDAVEDPDLFEEWRPEQGIFGGARRYVPPLPKGCTRDDAIN